MGLNFQQYKASDPHLHPHFKYIGRVCNGAGEAAGKGGAESVGRQVLFGTAVGASRGDPFLHGIVRAKLDGAVRRLPEHCWPYSRGTIIIRSLKYK